MSSTRKATPLTACSTGARNAHVRLTSKIGNANRGGAGSEELKMYTSRQLMEELAKRGYRGELEYVKKININKL